MLSRPVAGIPPPLVYESDMTMWITPGGRRSGRRSV